MLSDFDNAENPLTLRYLAHLHFLKLLPVVVADLNRDILHYYPVSFQFGNADLFFGQLIGLDLDCRLHFTKVRTYSGRSGMT